MNPHVIGVDYASGADRTVTAIRRPLFCPICGAGLMVNVASTTLPEVHRLPEHDSANGMNLCAGLVITVTIGYDTCAKCGCQMSKHPSGVCMRCYGEKTT